MQSKQYWMQNSDHKFCAIPVLHSATRATVCLSPVRVCKKKRRGVVPTHLFSNFSNNIIHSCFVVVISSLMSHKATTEALHRQPANDTPFACRCLFIYLANKSFFYFFPCKLPLFIFCEKVALSFNPRSQAEVLLASSSGVFVFFSSYISSQLAR